MDALQRRVAVALAAALLLLSPPSARPDEGDAKLWPPDRPREARSLEGLPLIVVDPGHGGADPGAVGPGGLAEAEVVWTVASALKLVLEEERVARVALTRPREANPTLAERTATANGQGASLFVSLHLAAAFQQGAKGSSAYVASAPGRAGDVDLNGASAEAFRPTRQPRPALPQAAPVRWETVHSPHREASQRVCATLLGAVAADGLFESGGLHEGDLPLLQSAAMPACLVELATLTHPVEEAALRQEATRRALVDALAKGLKAALEVAP